jgi:ATP-dependent protease ClpP protease subunit
MGATLALESAKLIGFSEHNMSDSPPKAPTPSTEVYAVFSDNVNQATTQRIFANFVGAMEKQFKHVHLLFQSSGGFVGDGICLYNFFSSLPIDLTIYNAGAVQSIALIHISEPRSGKRVYGESL